MEILVLLQEYLFLFIIVVVATLLGIIKAVEQYGTYALYFMFIGLLGTAAVFTGHVLYFLAFCLGCATALAEIIGKFSDEPLKSLKTSQALYYVLFNGGIASFALFSLVIFEAPIQGAQNQMKYVLVAGLGSMLIMRSKLFNIKVGGEDVSFGPEQIVKVFFRFMEQAIDRIRAQARIEFVSVVMKDVNFEKVYDYSLTMLESAQTLSEKERGELLECMQKIRENPPEDKQLKAYRLGFLILNSMGEDFVSKLYAERRPEWLLRAPVPSAGSSGIWDKLPWVGGKETPYFAYGSNLSSKQIRQRLGWDKALTDKQFLDIARPKRAKLKGYRLEFWGVRNGNDSGHGFAALIQDQDSVVEGVVYTLTHEILVFLDSYETGYTRKAVKLTVIEESEKGKEEKGKDVEAATYFAAKVQEGLKPENQYLEQVITGAKEYGLSETYINQLQNVAV